LERINDHLDKIEEILKNMDDVIDKAKIVPFSGKSAVDKEVLFGLIDEVRGVLDEAIRSLPNEIIQANRIVNERDRIIDEGKAKAEAIIKEGHHQVTKLVDEHEIARLAAEQATRIIDEGKKTAREVRVTAMEYADEILAKTEETIKKTFDDFNHAAKDATDSFSETIDEIYANRQSLRGPKK